MGGVPFKMNLVYCLQTNSSRNTPPLSTSLKHNFLQ